VPALRILLLQARERGRGRAAGPRGGRHVHRMQRSHGRQRQAALSQPRDGAAGECAAGSWRGLRRGWEGRHRQRAVCAGIEPHRHQAQRRAAGWGGRGGGSDQHLLLVIRRWAASAGHAAPVASAKHSALSASDGARMPAVGLGPLVECLLSRLRNQCSLAGSYAELTPQLWVCAVTAATHALRHRCRNWLFISICSAGGVCCRHWAF